jgi:hypothetical protein
MECARALDRREPIDRLPPRRRVPIGRRDRGARRDWLARGGRTNGRVRRGVEGEEPMGMRGEEVVRREVVAPVFGGLRAWKSRLCNGEVGYVSGCGR